MEFSREKYAHWTCQLQSMLLYNVSCYSVNMNLLQRSVRTKTSRHHRTLGVENINLFISSYFACLWYLLVNIKRDSRYYDNKISNITISFPFFLGTSFILPGRLVSQRTWLFILLFLIFSFRLHEIMKTLYGGVFCSLSSYIHLFFAIFLIYLLFRSHQVALTCPTIREPD
jgi:hypothetical protein